MAYLEELLSEFRKGAKIRNKKWEKGNYYILKNGEVVNQDNEKVIRFFTEAVLTDQWELYQEPEQDWDYIIKNKCLCWFWDEYEDCKVKGTLAEKENDNEYAFRIDLYNSHYRHCRPVRKDEVTFYEDKDNGQ